MYVENLSRDQLMMLSACKPDMKIDHELRYEPGQDIMKIYIMLDNQYNSDSTNYMHHKINAVFRFVIFIRFYHVVLSELKMLCLEHGVGYMLKIVCGKLYVEVVCRFLDGEVVY